jgi:hypothetical protein
LKTLLVSLLLLSLSFAFSVENTPFPANMAAGNTYNTTMTIHTTNPFNIYIYLEKQDSNPDEIELRMDGEVCREWVCNLSGGAGDYSRRINITLDKMLAPSEYPLALRWQANETAPDGTTTTSSGSSGGGGGSGGGSYYGGARTAPAAPKKANNTTLPIVKPEEPKPTAQNTTPPATKPVNTTVEPTAQNESGWWPSQPTLPFITPTNGEPPKEGMSWEMIVAGVLLFIGTGAFLVYMGFMNKPNGGVIAA